MANISLSTSRGKWAGIIFGVAAIIMVANIWAWWRFVRSDPERTFYAAIENSFRTQGVAKHVVQGAEGQQLEQKIHLSLGQQHAAHGHTTISQEGEVAATIKTETISLPKEDYVRYTGIETTQKNSDGKTLDFSSLLNIWGKSAMPEGQQASGELYGETSLGVVPVGNITADKRVPLMRTIRDQRVYAIDASNVEKRLENGRPVYAYDVTVAPEPYVAMLKQFGSSVGLKQLESIDPTSYKDAEPLKFRVTVDVWGRQITAIDFNGGARTERLSAWGAPHHVDIPKDAIPVEELQSRLQAVQ